MKSLAQNSAVRSRMLLVGLLLVIAPCIKAEPFLFASFRGNGDDGVHFAVSNDGYKWQALRSDQPWLRPQYPGMLMRDPWLGRGPDGVWHMLWTCAWGRDAKGTLSIGHASSRDLVHWSEQSRIPVMANDRGARNAWAPEAVWDAMNGNWIVFWASTVPGRFPASAMSGDDSYDHRIYASNTRNWKTFSPSRLWFDPGFNCIDATVVHSSNTWRLIFKDERKTPLRKQLRFATSRSPNGPWTKVSEPFSQKWDEGPTVLSIGGWWWIFFDHYTQPQHYGALKTRDWKHFIDETQRLSLPAGQRHGTAVAITTAELKRLQAAH